MFPRVLDGAEVIYYTTEDNYGAIRYPNSEIAEIYKYLAICKYSDDEKFYLFCCNKNYEVVGDSVWDSIEECIKVAASYHDDIAWIKAE